MTDRGESVEIHEAADGSELPMLVFEPANGTHPIAGIVMFHGGALHTGSPADLAPHCQQLASHDILAVSAGYRLIDQGATSIDDCIADVRRAIDHFLSLAARRGLEPSHLASGGSSAGAHLALVAAMIAPSQPAPAVQPGAAAVVALNPVVDLLAYPPEEQRSLEQTIARVPAGRLAGYSPIEYVRPGNPPTLIQHGTHDDVAPIGQVRRFRDMMLRAGNDCVLREYDQAEHAFHYPGPAGYFGEVIDTTAEFLLSRLAAG